MMLLGQQLSAQGSLGGLFEPCVSQESGSYLSAGILWFSGNRVFRPCDQG